MHDFGQNFQSVKMVRNNYQINVGFTRYMCPPCAFVVLKFQIFSSKTLPSRFFFPLQNPAPEPQVPQNDSANLTKLVKRFINKAVFLGGPLSNHHQFKYSQRYMADLQYPRFSDFSFKNSTLQNHLIFFLLPRFSRRSLV